VYRQSLRSGGKSKLIRQRTPSDESPLKPPFFDNIDPKRTSDEPRLGAKFRLGMNGLFGQCRRLCLRSWRDTATFMKRHG